MIRLPFYPFIEYRTKQVMFEIEGKIYKDRVNLHLVYDKEHVPDFYLAIFDEKIGRASCRERVYRLV